MERLDSLADEVEGQRLTGLGVLREDNLAPDCKTLSTRFVRTWREKKDSNGEPIWLRRSRLVPRPKAYLSMKEHTDSVMVAIDVKDAFLTVEQVVPTHIKDSTGRSLSLGRVHQYKGMAVCCGIET